MILTPENYYSLRANQEFFSVSQVKQFDSCEACAMAELAGEYVREKTAALLVGGYVDAHFSGELEAFKSENPEIFTKKGELRSEYQQAENIIARIERDALAMRMLSGEKQQILTGQIAGFPFKAKLDCWLDEASAHEIAKSFPEMGELFFSAGAIVDLKIVKDFVPLYRDGEGRLNFIEYWGYDLQMTVYQELKRQQIGEQVPCFILAATKERVPDLGLFQVPQSLMDANLVLLKDRLPHLADVKVGREPAEACGSCDHCKTVKELTGAVWLEEYV